MNAAWITGAHGFIGQHLAAHLAVNRHKVVGLGHGHWPADEAARHGLAEWLNAEIALAALDYLADRHGRPDTIYHLAGGSAVGPSFANPAEDYERTVHTTLRLLDWIRLRCPASRLVAVSSAAVYGAGHPGPIAESVHGRPFSPYGAHKAMMESLCRSYGQNFGLKVVVVRVFSAYGAGLRKQLLWDLCGRLSARPAALQLDGTGLETRDWIHVSDVARLLALVADTLPSADVPVLNGATGVGYSIAEVARLLVSAWGVDVPVNFSGQSRPGDPIHLVADVTLLRSLSFQPRVALPEGVCDYVAWFRRTDGR